MKLSIVVATLNRLRYLQACIASIEKSCAGIEHEIIVVDGGSTDGSLEWLHRQPVVLIEQGAAYGAVSAFNAGFYASEGDYVAALNDDCVVVGETLKLACDYLDNHDRCGQLAIPWHDIGDTSVRVMPVTIGLQRARVIYANFGVTRRWLGDRVGWWGTWEHYSGDCELSFNILIAGYTVDPLDGAEVLHFRVQDETRRICYHNYAFLEKWMKLDLTKTDFVFA